MNAPDRSPNLPRRPCWWKWGLLGLACLAGVTATTAVVCVGQRGEAAQATLELLRSDRPEERKLGAWLTAEQDGPAAVAYIVERLARSAEPVADVRETFVYALGHHGDPQYFALVADLARTESSGYVRQAAWLALARIDPQRLRGLADSSPPATDPWDQIGRAHARLHSGDVRGVPVLLHWAQAGNADQQLVACGALHKGLVPLLEAAGRWPLGTELSTGQIWPPGLLREVQQRCAQLDLQRIADDTRPHLAATREVQRNTRRVTSARNWIARFLQYF